MVRGKNRIPYWIDWRLTGLAEPDYGATISFGLPIEPEDSQYGKYRVVPGAETLIPEPGNSLVMIRQINDAVLREFSVVTSGAYDEAFVDLRAEANAVLVVPMSVYEWL